MRIWILTTWMRTSSFPSPQRDKSQARFLPVLGHQDSFRSKLLQIQPSPPEKLSKPQRVPKLWLVARLLKENLLQRTLQKLGLLAQDNFKVYSKEDTTEEVYRQSGHNRDNKDDCDRDGSGAVASSSARKPFKDTETPIVDTTRTTAIKQPKSVHFAEKLHEVCQREQEGPKRKDKSILTLSGACSSLISERVVTVVKPGHSSGSQQLKRLGGDFTISASLDLKKPRKVDVVQEQAMVESHEKNGRERRGLHLLFV